MYKDQVAGLEACMSHVEIIDAIDNKVKELVQADLDSNDGKQSTKGEAL